MNIILAVEGGIDEWVRLRVGFPYHGETVMNSGWCAHK